MYNLVIFTTVLLVASTLVEGQLKLGGLTKSESGSSGVLGGVGDTVGGTVSDVAGVDSVVSSVGSPVGDITGSAPEDVSDVDADGAEKPKGGLLGGVELLNKNGDSGGSVLAVPKAAKVNTALEGETEKSEKKQSLIGADVIGRKKTTNLDEMNTSCVGNECSYTRHGGLLDLGVGLAKDEQIKFTKSKENDPKYFIMRKYETKTDENKNIFGAGISKKSDEGNKCTEYSKCKKLLISPTGKRVEAPYLHESPYFTTKQQSKGVTKQVFTQTYLAPGTTSTATVNDNQYLVKFMETFDEKRATYDNFGTCNVEKLMAEPTAVYTLDELPCDVFYAAQRLYDIEKDTQNTLEYSNYIISLDEPAGIHWYKPATDPKVQEQLDDTDRLQKCYELLEVEHNTLDENAYFALKQNYSVLCTPDKENYKALKCPVDKFYSYDGTCNNPENPLIGKNPSSLVRFGSSHCPARCELPDARTVSLTLGYITNFLTFKHKKPVKQVASMLGLFFMNFAANDIVNIKTRGTGQQGGARGCTKDGGKLPDNLVSPHSYPIVIPEDDPVYGKYNYTCMEFVRAQPYNGKCVLKKANIGNFASAFLDLDQIYPKSGCEKEGYITSDGKIMASLENFPHISDLRAFETSQMMCISTLFALLHNQLADRIKLYSDNLSGYEIFQNARLINIYLYQYFYDYKVLPVFLGTNYTDYQEITSNKTCYNPKLDPSTLTEFAAAVIPYLHVFWPNQFNFVHPDYSVKVVQQMSQNYGGPMSCLQDFEACFRGMIYQEVNMKGHAYQPQNSLYQFHHRFGADLFSYDIQGSRDMCVKPYIFYVKKLFGVDIKDWEGLTKYIPVEAVLMLKRIYSDVCHVELLAGISVEKKCNDGLFGHVARKFMIEQHLHARCSDSKHYTNALSEAAKNCLTSINYNELFATLAGSKTTTKNIVVSDAVKNPYYTITSTAATDSGLDCLVQAVLSQ